MTRAELVARAEKRLRGHIARHGIDAEALAICARFEAMEAARNPAPSALDDLDAALAVVREVA